MPKSVAARNRSRIHSSRDGAQPIFRTLHNVLTLYLSSCREYAQGSSLLLLVRARVRLADCTCSILNYCWKCMGRRQNVRLGGWQACGVAALQALEMTRVQMGAIRQHTRNGLAQSDSRWDEDGAAALADGGWKVGVGGCVLGAAVG
jgi:hypothetical protein